MDKYLGKLLDNRYEILQIIGTGGMAVVYKALCHRLNRLVAVKVLKDEFAQDEEFRNRFRAESHAVAMLSHPNLVSVYDVSRSNSVEYIVMELIDGITLKQFMERKGVLTYKESVHFVTQILKALQHAHEKGIIHRDIKPHNVMLLRDGTIKVTDFGIARFVATQGTLNNEALGSVHYISPEQARGSHIDTRTDIYSTGVMLYEMITGRLPYEGDTPISIAVQHINSMPLSPRDINPDIPEALERITMKAMCANLNQRYASAEEMLQDLEAFRKNPEITFTPVKSEADESGKTRVVPIVDDKNAATTKFETDEDWDEDLYEDEKPRINFMLIGGIIAVSVLVCGIIALLATLFGGSSAPEVLAPNLLGKTYEEIMEDEAMRDFKIREEGQEFSDLYDKDQVMEQRPEAGESIRSGDEIYIVISKGPETLEMPNLINLSEQQARNKIEVDMGLTLELIREKSESVPEGYVIRTEPEAKTEMDSDTIVKVYISGTDETANGSTIPVPHLIGMSIEEAKSELTNAGLTVGTVRTVESTRAEGTVVYQSVKENTEVEKNSAINLQVSSGVSESDNKPQTNQQSTQPSTNTQTEQKPTTPQPDQPPIQQPSQDAKSRSITIKLPQSPDRFTLSAKINGVVVYSASHQASEGSATITVHGSGTQNVSIYIDNKLYNEVSVTFD